MGIAVWLVPSGENALKLESVMHAGMGTSHSASSYPKHIFHITITSFPSSQNIPLSTIRAAVPELQASIPVEFESIKIGDHFFRSVYIALKPKPDLLSLHEHVHKTLNLEPKTDVSYPHISLCYIDEEDARDGERDRFLHRLEAAGNVVGEDGRVGVKGGGEDWLYGFEASEVWIADCDGPVGDWNVLARIPLVPVKGDIPGV